eukprot:PhF_6_TR10612/c0_g1_i1/m.17119
MILRTELTKKARTQKTRKRRRNPVSQLRNLTQTIRKRDVWLTMSIAKKAQHSPGITFGSTARHLEAYGSSLFFFCFVSWASLQVSAATGGLQSGRGKSSTSPWDGGWLGTVCLASHKPLRIW